MKGFGFPHIGTDPAIEWMFALIVIFACFLIYFKTKELYELSGHKGIKYFRNLFLFFGISYIAKIAIKITRPIRTPAAEFSLVNMILPKIIVGIAIYASTAMFIYLLLSFLWKKFDGKFVESNWFIHGVSITLAIASIFQRIPFLFFIFQTFTFFATLFLIIRYRKKVFHKKQSPWVIATYAMIFGHVILIALFEIISLISPLLSSMIYIITLCFFVVLVDRFWLHFSKHEKMIKELSK